MHDMTSRAVLAALALQILAAASTVPAQGTARAGVSDYPTKPVRMIVPLAPGGGSDIVGRIVALELGSHWGQSVVVDNRPGAGSTVGTALAAKATADGYTLLVASSSIAISPALYKNLDFDLRRDLAGVTLIASQPSILAVHSSVPVNSVKELIALARAQPGKLTYASAGPGSATHLGAELLKYAAGIDILHVPYKSAGQAASALLSGETQILLTNMASVLPHVKSGRVKALGVSGLKRSPLVPDLPTVAEAGVPGFEYTTWYGMLVPTGTSRPIVNRLQAGVAKIIKTPQVQERFARQGLDVYGTSSAEFETYLNAEIAKWDRVVRTAGVRAE
jgi:tripartite-type tricarboxylate transporter receptor subunit TctC